LLERDGLRRRADVEGYAQAALDQDRDRRGVAAGPGLWPLFSVGMDAPLYLDVALVPEPQRGRNELADKPAAVAHLIHERVAKIEGPRRIHSRVPAHLLRYDTITDFCHSTAQAVNVGTRE